MRGKRTFLIASTVLLTFVAFSLWFRNATKTVSQPQTPQLGGPSQQITATPTQHIHVPPATVPNLPEAHLTIEDQQKLSKILTVFGTPIDFYGKVQDQYGNPVAGAKVHYSAADQYFGDASKYQGTSDARGFFSTTGIKGAGLYVEVSKDDYDRIPDQSYRSFGYGVPSGNQPPTKDNPAVFILRKKAEAEPLIVVSSRQYKVPNGGRPFEIDLRTGLEVGVGDGDLRIEQWSDNRKKDTHGNFNWRCRISAPGGGLIERNKDLDFQAPLDGYQESVEVDQLAMLGSKWQSSKEVQYFLKLKDQSFARVSLGLYGGYTNFLLLESYLNPSGSRNLEYDSKKVLKPGPR